MRNLFERSRDAEFQALECEMRKIMLFGIATVIVAAAATAWATTAPRPKDPSETVAVEMDVLALKEASTGLPGRDVGLFLIETPMGPRHGGARVTPDARAVVIGYDTTGRIWPLGGDDAPEIVTRGWN
jgi:hypothetical protein